MIESLDDSDFVFEGFKFSNAKLLIKNLQKASLKTESLIIPLYENFAENYSQTRDLLCSIGIIKLVRGEISPGDNLN